MAIIKRGKCLCCGGPAYSTTSDKPDLIECLNCDTKMTVEEYENKLNPKAPEQPLEVEESISDEPIDKKAFWAQFNLEPSSVNNEDYTYCPRCGSVVYSGAPLCTSCMSSNDTAPLEDYEPPKDPLSEPPRNTFIEDYTHLSVVYGQENVWPHLNNNRPNI